MNTAYQLVVLLELGQTVLVHERNASSLRFVAVLVVTQHAHGELGAGYVGQLHGTAETLVTSGVIVLQGNLDASEQSSRQRKRRRIEACCHRNKST